MLVPTYHKKHSYNIISTNIIGMVFSPKLKISIVQNATMNKGISVDIIQGSINSMVKTARILEQRKHLTRSPEVLMRDQMMLNKIYAKLEILGY